MPDSDFTSAMDILERTLAHEKKVTALINNLAAVANSESDFRTSQFLLWFISEQAEEETNCEDNIKRVKLAGEGGLFFVDQEFANRTYAAPTNPPVTI